MNNQLGLKTIIIFITLLFSNMSNAQINLEFTSVNEYRFSTKEATNLIVTNSTSKTFKVVFAGNIKDAAGNLVVEFKTQEADLNTGANIFSPQNLTLTEINYSNRDIAEIETSSGSYPSGNYKLCIWIICVSQDCNGLGSYYSNLEPKCIQIHIENPTPLILVTPENESEIAETRPLFLWIPPAPVAGSASLNYTMILMEILEGQSKADALTLSRPLIEMEGLTNPALMYPSDIPELEKGKWYAWQVEALVGKTPIAKSEQWKFKVKKDTLDLKKIPKEQSYIEIAGQSGTSMFYAVGELKLRHIVRLENGVVKLMIIDKKGKQIELDNNSFLINPGDNRLNLLLSNNFKFRHGDVYTLYGNLLNNEPFKLVFTYINPLLLK